MTATPASVPAHLHTPAPAIHPAEEASIAFYFSAQSHFHRSTFGAQLEHAITFAFNHHGRRIPRATDPWRYMLVRRPRSDSPGYTVEDDILTRFARASRRMLAVERTSPLSKLVLEAYYGERGDRWAHFGARMVGPGRIAAVFALTTPGRRLLERERLRVVREVRAKKGDTWESLAVRYCGGADRAGDVAAANGGRPQIDGRPRVGEKYGMPSAMHLTPDEQLANLLVIEQTKGGGKKDESRRVALGRSQDAAEKMLREAWGVWRVVGAQQVVTIIDSEAA